MPYRLLGAALALVAACVAVIAWGAHREAEGNRAGYDRGMAVAARIQAAWDADKVRAASAALRESEAARAEEQRRAEAQREVVEAYERQIQKVRADAAIADAAAGRLRDRVAALVAAARQAAQHPGAAASGPATDDATGMLADVLGRCVTRIRFLAAVADQRGAAGQACERSYDALSAATAASAPAPAAVE